MVSTTKPKLLGRVHWDIQPDSHNMCLFPRFPMGEGGGLVVFEGDRTNICVYIYI